MHQTTRRIICYLSQYATVYSSVQAMPRPRAVFDQTSFSSSPPLILRTVSLDVKPLPFLLLPPPNCLFQSRLRSEFIILRRSVRPSYDCLILILRQGIRLALRDLRESLNHPLEETRYVLGDAIGQGRVGDETGYVAFCQPASICWQTTFRDKRSLGCCI